MPKNKSKTEKLPPWNSPMRKALLIGITESYDYKLKIGEGYPLRTAKELEDISSRYQCGLTFEEINIEQAKKSPIIKLKKPTFRKYIQDDLLPNSKGYKTVRKKRMAFFPKEIISHINFLYYFYQVADNEIIDKLLQLLKAGEFGTMTYLEAILSFSDHDNIHAAIYHNLCFDDGDVEDAINKTLVNKPKEKTKALKLLAKIDDKFKTVDTEISKLIGFLKENKITSSEIPD